MFVTYEPHVALTLPDVELLVEELSGVDVVFGTDVNFPVYVYLS